MSELIDYQEATASFDPVLGIEVHVELGTATKMFDAAPNAFGGEPNSRVTPTSVGLPGSLPVVNAKGVEYAIRIGLALGCEIAESCRFARKNYFYPDQPKNYQISQYDEPIAYDGYLDVVLDDGTEWRVEIERAHMEEDTGKLTHIGGTDGRIHGATSSLVDCNRAGVPLIEIVTKPIIGAGRRAPEVARAYVAALRDLVKALGVSDARMDQGSMRVDSNVSLKPIGATEFGTRTETKNINSLRSVYQAVRYEMQRQAQVLADGGTIIQETRHYQETDGTTTKGRPKETADRLEQIIREKRYTASDYEIYAAVGTRDPIWDQVNNQLTEMLARRTFSGGNVRYAVKQGGRHDYDAIAEYLYNALPLYFGR